MARSSRTPKAYRSLVDSHFAILINLMCPFV
jgi:hypothetical protein